MCICKVLVEWLTHDLFAFVNGREKFEQDAWLGGRNGFKDDYNKENDCVIAVFTASLVQSIKRSCELLRFITGDFTNEYKRECLAREMGWDFF